MTTIEINAFLDCTDLTYIKIPESVTTIKECAFAGCSSLSQVYCCAIDVPLAPFAFAFDSVPLESAVLYVPETSIEAYKLKEPWNRFGTIVTLTGQELPVETVQGDKLTSEYYQLDGTKCSTLQRGLNIIRTKDGKRQKVLVKREK